MIDSFFNNWYSTWAFATGGMKGWYIISTCSHLLTASRQFHPTLRRNSCHPRPPLNLLQRHQSPHSPNRSETLLPRSRSLILTERNAGGGTRRKQIEIDAKQYGDHDLVRGVLCLLPQHHGLNTQHQPGTKYPTTHRRIGRRPRTHRFKSATSQRYLCPLWTPSEGSCRIIFPNSRTKKHPSTESATLFHAATASIHSSLSE